MSDLVTAADILKKLIKQNRCEGIDEFINTTLYGAFSQSDNYFQPIQVESQIINLLGWKRNIFMQEMKVRGFSISFNSDQRDGDFYTINIPKSA